MNIVIATSSGSLYGKKLINELLARQIPIAAIIVLHQPPAYYLTLFNRVRRRVGLLEALLFSLQRVLLAPRAPAEWRGRRFLTRYAEMAETVIDARSINSREVRRALQAQRCDLLILGQTGIVRSDVLSIPARGTLNAHPGILPEYRGIDCERWAIYRDELDKVGCTVHWVDAGVDTGDIIARERYELRAGETLRSLPENLYSLAARMLADVVAALLEGAPLAATRQRPTDGVQYYKMPMRLERAVRRRLRRLR